MHVGNYVAAGIHLRSVQLRNIVERRRTSTATSPTGQIPALPQNFSGFVSQVRNLLLQPL